MNIITTTNDIHTTKAKQNLDATNETTSVQLVLKGCKQDKVNNLIALLKLEQLDLK